MHLIAKTQAAGERIPLRGIRFALVICFRIIPRPGTGLLEDSTKHSCYPVRWGLVVPPSAHLVKVFDRLIRTAEPLREPNSDKTHTWKETATSIVAPARQALALLAQILQHCRRHFLRGSATT